MTITISLKVDLSMVVLVMIFRVIAIFFGVGDFSPEQDEAKAIGS